MTDDNRDLVAQVARREAVSVPVAEPITQEWNAPIDMVQADSMTLRQVIRGEVAEAKERVARWVPAPMPEDWYG